MNYFEKLRLVVIIFFFSYTFPVEWKGGEVCIFFIGAIFFFLGKQIEDALDLIMPDKKQKYDD